MQGTKNGHTPATVPTPALPPDRAVDRRDALSPHPGLDPESALRRLRRLRDGHPLWQNPLLTACRDGALTRDDFRYIFSQYHLYSRNFTRYLAALMASCEDDYQRARLSANLWEEGGMLAPGQRHAQLFRDFLRDGLAVDPERVSYGASARCFAREYLDHCLHAGPLATSAFLSLGTEGIVPQLYEIFVAGLLKAGIPESQLLFFRLHMAADDEHAATLEEIVRSFAGEAGWYERCAAAMTHALDLRDRFFLGLFHALRRQRLSGLFEGIQSGARRSRDDRPLIRRSPRCAGDQRLYQNSDESRSIAFTVDRVRVPSEVFDLRVLRIPPGRGNEDHRHPHESVFHVLEGRGMVHIDDARLIVEPGDLVFVPRWARHHTRNLGSSDLVILAITDFALTSKAFIGDPTPETRMTGAEAPLTPAAAPPSGPAALPRPDAREI
jgi:mannose-6-phosphate isomerase-like protein (cupin superfamily)/pyrroloquinoline quinone (PQQ) biosynthesis protein C